MDDRVTMLRQQMEVTKNNLTLKMEALEKQLTEKVQSAGMSVNATAVAVQEAVHSVGNVINVDRHFRRHPWLFLGGSFVLGYVATDWLQTDRKSPPFRTEGRCGAERNENPSGQPGTDSIGPCSAPGKAVVESSSCSPESETSREGNVPKSESLKNELFRAAVGAFSGITQELVARSMPQIVNFFRHDSAEQQRPKERRSNSVNPETSDGSG